MSGENTQQAVSPLSQMLQFIWPGAMAAQAVYVAAKLRLADLIHGGPKSVDELAVETKAHGPALHRFLHDLERMGIFRKDATGRFHNTQLSEVLRSDHPQSIRASAIMLGSPFIWRPWGELYESVVSGKPSFARIYGVNFFDHLANYTDDGAIFDAAMSSDSSDVSTILDAYDFSQFDKIVDVGGGQGRLLRRILLANPKVRGVLYDLPSVVAGATMLRAELLSSRCEIVAGDFFKTVPSGADAYLLKGIIHSWDDEDAVKILKNCRGAIRENGTLLLIGEVLNPNAISNLNRALMDLMMLVLSPGRERTESEYRNLLQTAGFSLTRVIPTRASSSIIEAQPL